ncbi:MAG: hypothetical protein IJ613_10020, partial [Muribaculaceae bacterium]|nr:hypothetical protein [Muribaculaceae bacterium]
HCALVCLPPVRIVSHSAISPTRVWTIKYFDVTLPKILPLNRNEENCIIEHAILLMPGIAVTGHDKTNVSRCACRDSFE